MIILERDRMLGRLIVALQGERKLQSVDIETLEEVIKQASVESPHILGALARDFEGSIRRLELSGWVSVDRSNPHVTITLPGMLVCAPLPLPDEVIDAFSARLDAFV